MVESLPTTQPDRKGRILVGIGDRFPHILEAAKAGDERAWALLYDDLAPVVLGYLRGRGAPDPEDLLGEVFVSAVRDLGGFSGDERSFRAWLLTIARNRLVDELRYRARRPSQGADPEDLERLGPRGDAEEEALATDDSGVRTLLVGLTPDQRDVVLLRVVAGLSVEETARVLGKRPGAVKALQHRALQAARRELEKEGVTR